MTTIQAAQALLPNGWAQDVSVEIGDDGRIARVASPSAHRADVSVATLVPAPVNVHSHAFQRAIAARAERSGPTENPDSFWTWRREMYRFLDRVGPDEVEAIAALAQMEMLEAGFASVAEFHYVHHQPDGTPYDDIGELAGRVIAASQLTDIGLTMLPVLYRHGGCDSRALEGGQRRFGNDMASFASLHERCRVLVGRFNTDGTVGVAPHSLRAVDPASLAEAVDLANGSPFHIHLAEQTAEVDEVHAHWGARPGEWLLANAPVDNTWCLIHATQLWPEEVIGLAKTGAVAGLCPITEANLGDGIFEGVRWRKAGGAIAVGSDSNVRINLAEELRTLDYSQRLRDRERVPLADAGQSAGRALFEAILAGGARAAGRPSGAIEEGRFADLAALDGDVTARFDMAGDAALDTFVFATGDGVVSEVWSAGRHAVRGGRHRAREAIVSRYRTALSRLTA